jgi:hypothetical protein
MCAMLAGPPMKTPPGGAPRRRGIGDLPFFTLGACGRAPDAGDAAMAAVEASPSFQAMKAHYPEDYRRMEGSVREAALRGASDEAARAAEAALGAVMVRQRPKADAETSVALYEVTRAEGEALRRVNPAACAAFMDGRGSMAEVVKVASKDLLTRDVEVGARLLAQSAQKPAPPSQPMPFDELLKLSTEALNTLADADQDVALRVLREERDPRTADEARVMCDFNLALADAILSRPKPIAGAMIRRLWAMK